MWWNKEAHMKSKSKKRATGLHAEAKRAKRQHKVVGFVKGGGVIQGVVGLVARQRMVTAAQAAETLGISKGSAQVRLWRAALAGRLVTKIVDGKKTYTVAKSATPQRSPRACRAKKVGTTAQPHPKSPHGALQARRIWASRREGCNDRRNRARGIGALV
jgi:hypothetical protein